MPEPKKYLITPAGGGAPVWYTEYMVPAAFQNKTARDVAKVQLGNENLFVSILKKIAQENNNNVKWYETLNPNEKLVTGLTLLLPPATPGADLGKFKIHQRMVVRTSPRVEAGNIFFECPIETEYSYKKSSKFTDPNGMTWVDVTASNLPRKVNGATYWMCVREGNVARTDPPV